MAEATSETARRAMLKSHEVCDLVKVQPYVLRSWEKEFPDLGVTRTSGGPRFYRKADVDRVVRIKQLVFTEGLTIAGARRRLEEERPPVDTDDDLPFEAPVASAGASADARARLDAVREGLKALLGMLAQPVPAERGNGRGAPVTPEAATQRDGLLPIEEPEMAAIAADAAPKPRKRSSKSRATS